jgi:hypothetical protein
MSQNPGCSSFFVVTCPGCHKRVSVALSNLGKKVSCLRCLTQFTAVDSQARSAAEDDPMRYWAEYTDLGVPDEQSPYTDETDLFRVPR